MGARWVPVQVVVAGLAGRLGIHRLVQPVPLVMATADALGRLEPLVPKRGVCGITIATGAGEIGDGSGKAVDGLRGSGFCGETGRNRGGRRWARYSTSWNKTEIRRHGLPAEL